MNSHFSCNEKMLNITSHKKGDTIFITVNEATDGRFTLRDVTFHTLPNFSIEEFIEGKCTLWGKSGDGTWLIHRTDNSFLCEMYFRSSFKKAVISHLFDKNSPVIINILEEIRLVMLESEQDISPNGSETNFT